MASLLPWTRVVEELFLIALRRLVFGVVLGLELVEWRPPLFSEKRGTPRLAPRATEANEDAITDAFSLLSPWTV